MPRAEEMTWDSAKLRWKRMYKGQMFIVSCRRLDEEGYPIPVYTKDGSRKAANEWWKRKEAELNAPSPEQRIRDRYRVEDLLERRRKAEEEMAATEQLLHGLAYRPEVPNTPNPKDALYATVLHEDGHTNLDGLGKLASRLEGKPAQTDRTIGYHAKRFLAEAKAKGQANYTAINLASMMNRIQTSPVFGADAAVDTINEQAVSSFYTWLDSSAVSKATQKHWFSVMARFVRYLYGQRLIEMPRNLETEAWPFQVVGNGVKVYPTAQVSHQLATLPPRLRLYALLGLNCAMLPVDMATLTWEEWQGQRVIRKRWKTRKRKHTPIVSYLLWDETREALEKEKSNHPAFVLASERGTPLWKSGNGRDNRIVKQWLEPKRVVKPTIPVKAFRSISANLLENHTVTLPSGESLNNFLPCVQHFLGHGPTTVKGQHYVAPPQTLFEEALKWLRTQFLG